MSNQLRGIQQNNGSIKNEWVDAKTRTIYQQIFNQCRLNQLDHENMV